MTYTALGMIESYGYTSALAGADAAVKAALVSIDHLEMVKGGIVTVFFTGDIGAVKSAVEAGEQESIRVGNFRRSHVIARVSEGVSDMLLAKEKKSKLDTVEVKEESSQKKQSKSDYEVTESELLKEDKLVSSNESAPLKQVQASRRSMDELMKMKVVKLRKIARSLDGISIERNQIKFSNKEDLVNAILASYERR